MDLEAYYRRQRWKVAVLIGVLAAMLWIVFSFFIAIWTAVFTFAQGTEITLQSVPAMVRIAESFFYPAVGYVTLPTFIIATLFAYFRSWQIGHAYLDRHWKNPYIKDDGKRIKFY